MPATSEIKLSEDEIRTLKEISETIRQKANKAKILLLANNGYNNIAIAERLGLVRSYVSRLRGKFVAIGMKIFITKIGSGRPIGSRSPKKLKPVNLNNQDEEQLKKIAEMNKKMSGKSKILLLMNNGVHDNEIAKQMNITQQYVNYVRNDFIRNGIRKRKDSKIWGYKEVNYAGTSGT